MSDTAVQRALLGVRASIKQLADKHKLKALPNLVAVSKLKPVPMLQQAYDVGQRHFGENYVQELCEKAPEMPKDIQWHFIGHLQSNKAKKVCAVPNLFMVETVDTVKLANALNKVCVKLERPEPLNVLVQVNTSGEAQKSGCQPEETIPLVSHIVSQCPALAFRGLMTIGRFDDGAHDDCFMCLAKCKEEVLSDVTLKGKVPPPESFMLSMGMSGDYEVAMQCGSTSIRVGSTIFGARDPK